MIADKEENRIKFCAAGDPAAVDGNDGVALVATDRQPEHGEDRHHGQRAGQEQQDGGGDHHHLLYDDHQVVADDATTVLRRAVKLAQGGLLVSIGPSQRHGTGDRAAQV